MSGIGHNGGPSMEPGFGFRRVAWSKARAALLPSLPLEVVRLRVKRAERLGLPYRTYATIRAVSGHDIVGFLFSDAALELRGSRPVPASVVTRLGALDGAAARLGAIHAPRDPAVVAAALGLEAAARAPGLLSTWRETRDGILALVRAGGVRADGVVVVSDHASKRDWCGAANLAGIVPRAVVFGA